MADTDPKIEAAVCRLMHTTKDLKGAMRAELLAARADGAREAVEVVLGLRLQPGGQQTRPISRDSWNRALEAAAEAIAARAAEREEKP